jgi:hypothetical protein
MQLRLSFEAKNSTLNELGKLCQKSQFQNHWSLVQTH